MGHGFVAIRTVWRLNDFPSLPGEKPAMLGTEPRMATVLPADGSHGSPTFWAGRQLLKLTVLNRRCVITQLRSIRAGITSCKFIWSLGSAVGALDEPQVASAAFSLAFWTWAQVFALRKFGREGLGNQKLMLKGAPPLAYDLETRAFAAFDIVQRRLKGGGEGWIDKSRQRAGKKISKIEGDGFRNQNREGWGFCLLDRRFLGDPTARQEERHYRRVGAGAANAKPLEFGDKRGLAEKGFGLCADGLDVAGNDLQGLVLGERGK